MQIALPPRVAGTERQAPKQGHPCPWSGRPLALLTDLLGHRVAGAHNAVPVGTDLVTIACSTVESISVIPRRSPFASTALGYVVDAAGYGTRTRFVANDGRLARCDDVDREAVDHYNPGPSEPPRRAARDPGEGVDQVGDELGCS